MSGTVRDILSIVLLERGAVGVRVTASFRGLSAAPRVHITDLTSLSPGDIAEQLGGPAARVVITLWPGRCLIRPVAFDLAEFRAGHTELERSAGDLFPMPADDVALGYVRRVAADDGTPAGGYVVATQRSRMKAMVDQFQQALGAREVTTLAPIMSMLGLGAQSQERAFIDEPSQSGTMRHGLRHGQIVELGADAGDDPAWAVLPSCTEADEVAQAEALALAAVIALRVAPQEYEPFMGRRARHVARWGVPAALVTAATLAFVAAPMIGSARREAALERVHAARAVIADQVAEVQGARADLDRYAALVRQAGALDHAGSATVLEDLASIHALIPPSAFLERIEIRGAMVTLRGAADRAGDVLALLEASPAFESARNVNPPAPLGAPINKEEFEISAQRSRALSTAISLITKGERR